MQNKIKKNKILIKEQSIKSLLYDDYYFNTHDGIGESSYVFLKTNELKKRFNSTNNFVIAELGFGTGLNFLLTLDLWLKNKLNHSILHYISFEKNPLSNDQLSKILSKFKKLQKTEKYSKLIVRLPLHTGLSKGDISKIINKITDYFKT